MLPTQPLVTVLMPSYNAGDFLREAVDSVLNQTYSNFEFLIINDGSTDNTKDILAGYSDERIKVIHQENMGLVASLNKGIDLAKGEYIARFDADDVCYPQRLMQQMTFLEKHPEYVLIGGEADYMTEEGEHIFKFEFSAYTDEEIRAEQFKDCPFIHSTVVFLKQAVQDVGGYDPRAITFEDHQLWKKVSEKGKMMNMHEALIKVRFNAASATIDEKWRGEEFIALKQRSIKTGLVADEDYKKLQQILREQDVTAYKQAAYHSMLGKKFLWNQYQPSKARKHLGKAISIMPSKAEPYLLYLLSFLPKKWIASIYKKAKS
ncbi:MAG: glycosyltransferase family 2 protein [Flavipsychrobacter sp.]